MQIIAKYWIKKDKLNIYIYKFKVRNNFRLKLNIE